MQISVLLEPVPDHGFRAISGEPFGLTVEGSTSEEALARLRSAIQARLQSGSQIATITLPDQAHPLAPYAGMFKDNPLFDEWRAAVDEYRDSLDE